MQALLLGLAALILALAAAGIFVRASSQKLAVIITRIAGVLVLAGSSYALFRGQLVMALGLGIVGLWLLGGQMLPGRGPGPASPGNRSRVVTEHLEMELDHDTGEMRGKVLKGFFSGRSIEDLRPVELAHLWQDCRFADPQSAQLVEAYLDRIHPSWREDMARAEAEAPKGPDGRMTRAEALEILGLKGEASDEEIRRAHRELMLKLHPDRGGSTYLAAKVNEAKDVLLGDRP
jgi:hypothetical protein